jgi:hypothetical protein
MFPPRSLRGCPSTSQLLKMAKSILFRDSRLSQAQVILPCEKDCEIIPDEVEDRQANYLQSCAHFLG